MRVETHFCSQREFILMSKMGTEHSAHLARAVAVLVVEGHEILGTTEG